MASLLFSAAVQAGSAEQVSIVDPYIRLAPPNAQGTVAFMTLKNSGEADVKLLKADNPATRVTELHTHLREGWQPQTDRCPGGSLHGTQALTC